MGPVFRYQKSVLILLIITIFCCFVAGAEEESDTLSDESGAFNISEPTEIAITSEAAENLYIEELRTLVPEGLSIDDKTLNELFNPVVIESEEDAPFIEELSGNGFVVQQGAILKADFIIFTELGIVPDAQGNNADNPYYCMALPRSPTQTVPNDGEYPNGMCNNFRIRADEAIVMIGTTPSDMKFYNYMIYLIDRSYGPERRLLFAGLGDSINIGDVKAQTGSRDGFNEPIMIIYSADKTVAERVKSLAEEAGYPESMIFIKEIPSQMVNMGLEEDDDTFACNIRTAIYDSPESKMKYMEDVFTMYRAYRVTPESSEPVDPYPVKDLKIRGTGRSEFGLMNSVNQLRDAIIAAYPDYTYIEPDTTIWLPESPEGMHNDENSYGESRDTPYLGSQNFTLGEDQFAISYGVNHMASGKAVYSNIVAYGTEKLNGVISVDSTQFGDSADRYIPDDPNAPMLYAYTISRVNSTEPYTMVVPQGPFLEGIPLEDEMWIGWRAYMEPETKVGPASHEIINDKVIVFTPK